MASIYSSVEREDITDLIILDKKDYVGGSGVLQYFTPGSSFPLQDIIMLMIIQCDNTAINLLIYLVGVENIRNTMKEAGMVYGTFYNKLMLSKPNPIGANRIAPMDIGMLLHKMATGKLVSSKAS